MKIFKKPASSEKRISGKKGFWIFRKKNRPMPKFEIFLEKKPANLPTTDFLMRNKVIYPLIKPFAYASISYEVSSSSIEYKVMEPVLDSDDLAIMEKIKEGLIQIINVSLESVKKREAVIDFLEHNVQKLLNDYGFEIRKEQYLKIMYFIYRDFIGMNEIEPLMQDPYIEDIGCDGIGIPVYVIHQKYGSVRTNIVYENDKELREFVTKLSERCDRYISYAEPLLDGTLPDGTRVHASIASDVTTRGPVFSLRKFRETPFTPVDLINLGTVSSEMLAYLWFIVENGRNVLVTGGVATGKTSLLNCISMFIPAEAKIVSIEDTRELNLPHENWIPNVSRSGFTSSGTGEVTMFELLKESFRQNPDYLIVGEVRGREAYILFQGMASGHPSMSTFHSGGVEDLIKRLQTKPISLSAGLLESLDIIITMVHAQEKGKSARRAKEIVEIESIDSETGISRTNKVFSWRPSMDIYEYRGSSWVLSKISSEKGISMQNIIKEISKRKEFIDWMCARSVTKMSEAVGYMKLYRTDPSKIEHMIAHQ